MSLFDNPMIDRALKALTPEQVENYQKIGQQMYGDVNFTDNKILSNLNPPMAEAVGYIEIGLKSGLHPNDLEENEIKLLEETFGATWYERYGYSRDEVNEVGLSLQIKNQINDLIEKKIEYEKNKPTKKKRKKKRT